MREHSNPATTLDKVRDVKSKLRILLRLRDGGAVAGTTANDWGCPSELKLVEGETYKELVDRLAKYDEKIDSIFTVLDMVEEEVDVMAKCQYEMRKRIQKAKYG